MAYRVTINTDNYKCAACSKKNWEPGTINDYMIAINGWSTTERNLKEVEWRLLMLQGNDFPASEWENNPDTEYGLSEKYLKWQKKKCNEIIYHDRLCGFDRRQKVSGYGIMQGYLDIDEKIKELKENGSVKIYFSGLYDSRQKMYGLMKGCYMEIKKIPVKVKKQTPTAKESLYTKDIDKYKFPCT
jgi:hypothetical protein